jgi:hypothetical protein
MSDRPVWATILQWTLWAFAIAALMGWLGKARMKPASPKDAGVLAYPRSALVLAVICVVFFAAATVIALWVGGKDAPWWTALIFAVFALVSVHFMVDCWVSRYRVSEEGLLYSSTFVRNRLFKWGDLSVRYAPAMKWFILKDTNGNVARVSIMMTGLPEFARLLLNHVQPVAIDSSAHAILRQTAKGEPPSIWP